MRDRRLHDPHNAIRGIMNALAGSAVLWALLFSAAAHGQVRPEIGAGFVHATARHDGTWWQRAFPHSLGLNNPSIMVGLRYDAMPHIDVHARLHWFGHYSSDARAIPNDPAYDPATDTCVGPCLPRAHYIGHGWLGAASLTAGWHTLGPWQFGVHAGALRYRESWSLDVPDWYTAAKQPDGSWKVIYRVPIHTRDLRWAMGYTAGAEISHGPWALSLDWYRDGGGFPGHNGVWPPIWRWHTVLSLVRTF